MSLSFLTVWGEKTRNKLRMRTTRCSNLVIGMLVASLLLVTVEGWQIVSSFTLIVMLVFLWMRWNYEKKNS